MNLIPDGRFKSYETQQRKLLDLIERHGGRLHQDDFDTGVARMTFGAVFMDRDTPMLGDAYRGPWASWLDLLQHMVAHGVVEQQGIKPNIFYCTPEVAKCQPR